MNDSKTENEKYKNVKIKVKLKLLPSKDFSETGKVLQRICVSLCSITYIKNFEK